MTETQQRLRDIGRKPDAPVCYKDEQVGPIWVLSKGEICPGYVGPIINRDQYGFVGFRTHRQNFHRKTESYVLSDRVLQHLRERGVQLICIAEEDTGRVYEWHHSQWAHDMPQHGKSDDEKDEDQTFAPVDEAWGVFENHVEDVLLGDREVN